MHLLDVLMETGFSNWLHVFQYLGMSGGGVKEEAGDKRQGESGKQSVTSLPPFTHSSPHPSWSPAPSALLPVLLSLSHLNQL